MDDRSLTRFVCMLPLTLAITQEGFAGVGRGAVVSPSLCEGVGVGGEVVFASPAGGGGGHKGGARMPRRRSGEGASEHEAGALQDPSGSFGSIDSPHCLLPGIRFCNKCNEERKEQRVREIEMER